MLIAKEKVDYYSLPEEKPKTIKKKQKAIKLNKRAKIACSLLVFVAFLFGLLFTSRYAQLATTGTELRDTRGVLAEVQLETEQLKKEVDRLQSLDRIEKIATQKLGMQLPESEGVYFVAVEYEDIRKEASVGVEEAEQVKGEKDTIISAVSVLWANWLGDIQEAEADTVN